MSHEELFIRIFGSRLLRFYRFALVGGFVTVLSLALLYLFLKVLGTPLILTYVLLYIATIFVSYLMNSSYTFGVDRSHKRLALFYGTYIITMLLGAGLLKLLRMLLPWENWLLSFMVVPVTMVCNYVLSSLVFGKKVIEANKDAV